MVKRRPGVEVLVAITKVVWRDEHLANDHAFGGEQFSVRRHEVDLSDGRQRLQPLRL